MWGYGNSRHWSVRKIGPSAGARASILVLMSRVSRDNHNGSWWHEVTLTLARYSMIGPQASRLEILSTQNPEMKSMNGQAGSYPLRNSGLGSDKHPVGNRNNNLQDVSMWTFVLTGRIPTCDHLIKVYKYCWTLTRLCRLYPLTEKKSPLEATAVVDPGCERHSGPWRMRLVAPG